jgi:hypothetical protein
MGRLTHSGKGRGGGWGGVGVREGGGEGGKGEAPNLLLDIETSTSPVQGTTRP